MLSFSNGMPLYRYVKSFPEFPNNRRRSRILSFFLITLGGAILVWTFWPIISFSVINHDLFSSTVTPLPDTAFAATPNGAEASSDFSNPNAWFPTAPQKKVVTPINTYTLSIPKLKIGDATVTVAGDDLSTSLVHYGGTAMPGDYGNTVIFGHSTLPQFYNPKNYTTIFSLLPSLKIGDEIDVTSDGVSYKYIVYNMTVSEPGDLSALEQRFDDSYLTLITCVPPGTWWQRLHVFARLDRSAL